MVWDWLCRLWLTFFDAVGAVGCGCFSWMLSLLCPMWFGIAVGADAVVAGCLSLFLSELLSLLLRWVMSVFVVVD